LLLVVNSNLGRISHGFGATATYWSKVASMGHTLSYLTPSLGVISCEYVGEPYIAKTRYFVLLLLASEDGIILRSFVLTQHGKTK